MRLSSLGWIARGQHHHRQVLVDQRVGPVLHLAGRIAFGVDVGDLLQLERAFERDGEMHAAAEEEEIGGAVQLAAQGFVDGVVGEHGFELAGKAQQLLHQAARRLFVEPSVGLAQVHGQDEQARSTGR